MAFDLLTDIVFIFFLIKSVIYFEAESVTIIYFEGQGQYCIRNEIMHKNIKNIQIRRTVHIKCIRKRNK